MKLLIAILLVFLPKIDVAEFDNSWGPSYLLQNSLSHSQTLVHFFHYYVKTHNFTNEDVQRCYQDIEYAFKAAFIDHQHWALTMFDAYGKPETGIFDGNLRWEGNTMQCAEVNGKYCWLELPLSVKYKSPQIYKKPSIEMAICAPESCGSKELQSIANCIINELHHFVARDLQIRVRCIDDNQKSIKTDQMAQIALAILFIIIAFMICGTYVDFRNYKNLEINPEDDEQIQMKIKNSASLYVQFLLCFSIISNGKKIFQVECSNDEFAFLHGLRVLGMWGVVVGHTFTHLIPLSDNPVEMLFTTTHPGYQLWANLYSVVDVFFVITGFLTVYLLVKEVINKGLKCNFKFIAAYIAHRYWRLVSTQLFILFIFRMSLLSHLGSGPMWENPNPQCRHNWWRHILFINNLFPHETGCDATYWFLASSMQLHLFSLILVLPLFKPKGRIISLLLGGLIFVISCAYVGYLSYHNKIPPTYDTMTRENAVNFARGLLDYKYLIYIQSHFHVGPYLIGMATGWFLSRTAQNIKISQVQSRVGWILSIVVTIGVFYGKLFISSTLCNAIFHSVFGVLCGSMFAWIIVACFCGRGGVVKSFLSWKYFHPLSKINYTLYLIHPTVILHMYRNETVALHFSFWNMLGFFLRHLLVSVMVAIPLSLAFESPMLAFEKLVIQMFSKKRSENGAAAILKKKKLKVFSKN